MRLAAGAHGLATTAGLLLVGLGPRPAAVALGAVLLVAAGSVVGGIASASAALPPTFRLRYATTTAVWTALLVAVLLVGVLVFPHSVGFWAPGALACAVPGLWFAHAARTV